MVDENKKIKIYILKKSFNNIFTDSGVEYIFSVGEKNPRPEAVSAGLYCKHAQPPLVFCSVRPSVRSNI